MIFSLLQVDIPFTKEKHGLRQCDSPRLHIPIAALSDVSDPASIRRWIHSWSNGVSYLERLAFTRSCVVVIRHDTTCR